MRVCYVTMQFPAPSETFASNDVRELTRLGVRISVHGLLPEHRSADRLIRERRLEPVSISHNGIRATARGVARALAQRRLLAEAIGWLLRSSAGRLVELVRSLVLLPRAFDILAEIGQSRPQVVHIYWGHYPAIVGFLVQRALPEVATSISLAAYDLEMAFGGTRAVARNSQVIRTLGRVNVPGVAALTGVPPEQIEVIHDGVDIAFLEGVAAGRRKVARRVVTAGRLIESKGVDDVLAAFATLGSRWPDASLVILGDGPERERLRAQAARLGIEDRVSFPGHVSQERVIEELAAAEVFLLLSRKSSERLPNVVKEGMACRAVCITTPTPGIDELVVDGETGLIVPMHAPEAAAQAIDDVFAGRVPAGMADGAREHVVRNFDMAHTSREYLRVWRAAADRHAAARRAAAPVRGARAT
ncbi:MAG: glycosyltransferase [Trueperaceae bacterium]